LGGADKTPDAMIGASLQENDVSCMHYICKDKKMSSSNRIVLNKKY
jgi:hypothetical protein